MIEISVSNLVLSIGVFFLLGMTVGVTAMFRVAKKELDKFVEDLCQF